MAITAAEHQPPDIRVVVRTALNWPRRKNEADTSSRTKGWGRRIADALCCGSADPSSATSGLGAELPSPLAEGVPLRVVVFIPVALPGRLDSTIPKYMVDVPKTEKAVDDEKGQDQDSEDDSDQTTVGGGDVDVDDDGDGDDSGSDTTLAYPSNPSKNKKPPPKNQKKTDAEILAIIAPTIHLLADQLSAALFGAPKPKQQPRREVSVLPRVAPHAPGTEPMFVMLVLESAALSHPPVKSQVKLLRTQEGGGDLGKRNSPTKADSLGPKANANGKSECRKPSKLMLKYACLDPDPPAEDAEVVIAYADADPYNNKSGPGTALFTLHCVEDQVARDKWNWAPWLRRLVAEQRKLVVEKA